MRRSRATVGATTGARRWSQSGHRSGGVIGGTLATTLWIAQPGGDRVTYSRGDEYGRRRPTGPADWLEADERVSGWRATLEQAGAPVPEPVRGDWSAASGHAAGQVLAARDDVEAVFVANDQMALGVLRAFHERGVRVPEDVLLVGFDDIPESAFFTPPLTTVLHSFIEVGRRSIERLLAQIAGDATQQERVVIAPQLVVRQSSLRNTSV